MGWLPLKPRQYELLYPHFFYSTYDPAKGGWQNQTWFYNNILTASNFKVETKNGVVLLEYETTYSGITEFYIHADIYDPENGQWFSESSSYGQEVIYTDSRVITNLRIVNATIYFKEDVPLDAIEYQTGYDPSQHKWDFWDSEEGGTPVTTKPGAYFVAQPTVGIAPLWVWFTDMSIGGTSYYWDFDDNSGSSSYPSPYHTYSSNGTYQVSLQINGGSTYSKTISVWKILLFKGGPAIFRLLLPQN